MARSKATKKQAEPGSTSEVRRVARLLVTYSGGRRVYVSALFLLTVEAVSAIYQPYPIAYLIDFFRADRPPLDLVNFSWLASPRAETVLILTVGLVALTMFNSAADSLAEIRLARGGRTLGFNTRQALYQRLHRLSLAFHGHRRTGDMLTRVTSDVTAVEDFVVDSVSDLAGSFLVLVGTLAFLFYKSWQVAVVAILIVPLLSLISNYFSQRIKTASKTLRAREGDLASAASEMLSSIRVIQTYGRSGYEEKRFAEHSRSAMEAALVTAGLKARFSWVVAVLESVAISAVAWIGIKLIDTRTVTVGTLVLFVILIQNMFKPTRKIIREWTVIGKIFASVERIAEVLDREAGVQDRPGATVARTLEGRLEFRDVRFGYQLDAEDAGEGPASVRQALKGVSFEVAPGQVVALVGASGAGKSTIAQLIPRLYDPDEGAVLVDNTDIRDFTLDSLRANVSVVLQETILFSGTVADNIAYGREDATLDEVTEAAMKAQAHGFIVDLPDGYDTVLGERGANLSGGQRQRIAIARAFVRNAPLLILDEPTTGLDSAAATQVIAGLESLMRGKSTIVISHDLHLVRAADKILVLGDGQVVQSGVHGDLLAIDGPYADFCAQQGLGTEARLGADAGMAATASPSPGAKLDPDPSHEAEKARESVSLFMPEPALARPEPAMVGGGGGAKRVFSYGRELTGRLLGDRTGPFSVLAPGPAGGGPKPGGPTPVDPGLLDWDSADRRKPDRPEGPLAAAFNPLASDRLNGSLPDLELALDADLMRGELQRCFYDQGDASIEGCSPGKAMLLDDGSIALRYALTVRTNHGSGHSALVLARLFTDQARAGEYRRQGLGLAEAIRGRGDVAEFSSLVCVPEGVPLLVAHPYPIDVDIPTLVGATDTDRMLEVFAKALGRAGLAVQRCQVDLQAYGRRHRCVLRYALDVTAASGRKGKAVVFGKAYSGDTGALVSDVVTAASAHLRSIGRNDLVIPSHLTYLPELRLSLLNRVPGAPVIAKVIKAACTGQTAEPQWPTPVQAVDDAARVAAAMHAWPTTSTPQRSLAHDTSEMRRNLRAMRSVSPALAAHLGDHLDEIEAAGVATVAGPVGFGHGDFSLAQLMHEGQSVALIDFDSACQTEAALDLGHFLAYLRLAIARHQLSPETGDEIAQRLSWRFLDSYAAEHGRASSNAAVEDRVRVFKALSLMRITVHAWQKLKPDRTAMALSLLDQEVRNLP